VCVGWGVWGWGGEAGEVVGEARGTWTLCEI